MKLRWGRVAAVVIAAALCVTAVVAAFRACSGDSAVSVLLSSPAPASSEAVPSAPSEVTASSEDPGLYGPAEPEGWCLTLVNADHPVPAGYTVRTVDVGNGQTFDERAAPDLFRLFDAARAAGFAPVVREGYRSHEDQIAIMEERIARYVAAGKSRDEAMRLTAREVALPGTSEHELGLAVDINDGPGVGDWPLYGWLAENAWQYGFILRFPEKGQGATGYAYEPWHYRYVGEVAAREIHEKSVTLEEYLAWRRNASARPAVSDAS